jgi:hypothetical protein
VVGKGVDKVPKLRGFVSNGLTTPNAHGCLALEGLPGRMGEECEVRRISWWATTLFGSFSVRACLQRVAVGVVIRMSNAGAVLRVGRGVLWLRRGPVDFR